MDLTNEQRQAVKQWLAEGASLSDVQKRLKDELGVSMTFMDVRLLVLDLGVAVKEKPQPKPPPPPAPEPDEDALGGDEESAPDGAIPFDQPEGKTASKVSVTLDRIVRPGALVSGTVTFSDGTNAKWVLDQMGRLGLDGVARTYRPPPEDVQDFQMQLQSLLKKHGYG